MQKFLKKRINFVGVIQKNYISSNKFGNIQSRISYTNITTNNKLNKQTSGSYYFSSFQRPNSQQLSQYNVNNPQRNVNERSIWDNEKEQPQKVQINTHNQQNGKFFYSHTKVSQHFVLREEEIYDTLQKFNLQYKVNSSDTQIQIEFCPFCLKPHNNDIKNAFTLCIKKQSGQFNCFRCQINGSWFDFKNLLYKNISVHEVRNYNESYYQEQKLDDSEYYLYHKQLFNKDEYKQELEYLCGKSDSKQRHLNFDILSKYKVGIGKEEFINREGDYIKVPVIYFPMFKFEKSKNDSSDEEKARNVFENQEEEPEQQRIIISDDNYKLIKCKIRGIGSENKKYMRIKPSGSKSGIFGLNTVPLDAKEIVITEGEYDAMAVHQATGFPAISLPNGASGLPLEAIGCLDRFDKIYLWLDNDEVGRNNTQKLAEKLGLNRTHIVNTSGEKDANDILRQDPSRIIKYIKESHTVPDQSILTFSDLKEQVYFRLLKFENNYGIRSKRFDFFNQTIMGLRKGELTVLTGPTGSGKTTFLSQLSLDFCQQQVPTLWGSFEIKNEVLATSMIMQMSGQDLYKQHQKFPYWADKFDMIPMYFMNFFGSTNLDQILSTIDYSIYKYDIQHVVIDNLQFLLGTQAKGFEKFDLQDKTIEAFRQLATRKDVHLTLVIHPKKVEESEDLNISSVFGSAKATQEADNVIILQNREKYRVVDLKKNRFNGEIGKKAILFDKSNKNFYEMSLSEVSDVISSKQSAADLVKAKREAILQQIEQDDLNMSKYENQKNKKPNSGNDGDNNDGGNNGNSNNPSSSSSFNTPPSTPPPQPNNSQGSSSSSEQSTSHHLLKSSDSNNKSNAHNVNSQSNTDILNNSQKQQSDLNGHQLNSNKIDNKLKQSLENNQINNSQNNKNQLNPSTSHKKSLFQTQNQSHSTSSLWSTNKDQQNQTTQNDQIENNQLEQIMKKQNIQQNQDYPTYNPQKNQINQNIKQDNSKPQVFEKEDLQLNCELQNLDEINQQIFDENELIEHQLQTQCDIERDQQDPITIVQLQPVEKIDDNLQKESSSNQKKQNNYEDYDTQSYEPENFDLYNQNKQIPPKKTFFKNFEPLPLEEQERCINGFQKYQNKYQQKQKQSQNYTQNKKQIASEELDQILNEQYSYDDQILENKILQINKSKSPLDDLGVQQIEKKRQAKKKNI